MYGIILIVVLVLTGGVIAFIGDRLGSKVGKKRLSLFGMRPRHTSILVTIITGILITTTTFGVLAIASKDVRTALFGMEKLKAEAQQQKQLLEETTGTLNFIKQDLDSTKEEYAKSKNELAQSKDELAKSKEAADNLRIEQQALQAKNNQLWASNQNLLDSNSQLQADNDSLTTTNQDLLNNNSGLRLVNNALLENNNNLKSNNAQLEKLNDDLKQGIEDMREKPIIYRVGELLASGIIHKTSDQQQIQTDLGQIVELANSKIVDRVGPAGAQNGVWIYPTDYQDAIATIQKSQTDMVVRLIVAANLVKGDAVLTRLELHPNRLVYAKDQLIYQKVYNVSIEGTNSEELISDFLRNVNATAVNNGILPNPLTGSIGVISGSQLYSIGQNLQNARGNVLISAYALQDTEVLGPLRLNITLKEDDKHE